jgi:hypothetical protein
MFEQFKNIYKPELYHGHDSKPPFFEGWFFKLVDQTQTNIYAIIPGVFLAENQSESHAFIQVLQGHTGLSDYIRFPLSQFNSNESEFHITLGGNEFSSTGLSVDIKGEKLALKGTLEFQNTHPWPVEWNSPGVMGPYAFAPFMQCYHGVLSMNHSLEGELKVNDQQVDFSGGLGYIEKDWGRSFPSAYIWAQSNHFEKSGVSLFISVANIPWLTGAFRGFLAGFLLDGTLHRFATYTGAELRKVAIDESRIEISLEQKDTRLDIVIEQKTSGMLHGPYEAQMAKKVTESLDSEMHVHFTKNGDTVFKGTGKACGLDVNGNMPEILLDNTN